MRNKAATLWREKKTERSGLHREVFRIEESMQGEFPFITTAVAIFHSCYYDSFSEIYNNVMPSLDYIRTAGTALDLDMELPGLPGRHNWQD